MGEMATMNHTGDTKTIWDIGNPDEVEAARKTFNQLTGKGYAAFRVTGKDGEKGEQIRTFEPEAGKIILCPPLRGGR